MNDNEETVACWSPEFDNYVCTTYKKVEELEFNIEKMRQEYNGLLNFHKALLKSQIKERAKKGEDTADLEFILKASEQKFDKPPIR
jgi:hypothetical protein